MKLNFEDVQVSELTNTLTKQLFNKIMNLPNLKTSSEMHLPLFKLFCKKYTFYKVLQIEDTVNYLKLNLEIF